MQGNLAIVNLNFRFSGQDSDLFHVENLALDHGQTLGVRGASGAGKTTLLHCLAGIESPGGGSIRWGNDDICTMPAAALTRWRQQHLGLVFQDFHLVEGLSALDNVLLPATFNTWRPTPTQRNRAAELLHRVGLDSPSRRAELLSRGERQRVAVARALLFEPAVVLADEPTASLDPANREIIGNLLLDLVREQSATLVVISHEAGLLDRLDRQYELHNGSLHAVESDHV